MARIVGTAVLRIQDEATVLPFFLDPFTGKDEGGEWQDGGYAL